jgi:hypothetical protein
MCGRLRYGPQHSKEGSSSFLKKRTKKLLFVAPRPTAATREPPFWDARAKVFWFFFSKKNCFLAFVSFR